ncbi:universal stress protein [Ramlibacter sp. USB13]|uniref:Universal stress protein n=1 Tax=Ramlibacter cellulosilyticus TaxID=2764187 RepID=A0A923SBB7_9BURK|nr:universal stress protein [Ramlibacter cellulosilyticus]MBC5783701.1 universal stress protein [Ramlibacter cellulosilyticus]
MFEKILMPTDGSDVSLGAAERAIELARLAGGTLLLVFVHERYPYGGVGTTNTAGLHEHLAKGQRLAAEAFERVRGLAEGKQVRIETAVLEGDEPAERIVEAARSAGVEQIVMASRGRTGAARLLLGSVTSKVLELSGVPVLVVK